MHESEIVIFYFLRVPSFHIATMPNFSHATALESDAYFLAVGSSYFLASLAHSCSEGVSLGSAFQILLIYPSTACTKDYS